MKPKQVPKPKFEMTEEYYKAKEKALKLHSFEMEFVEGRISKETYDTLVEEIENAHN